MVMFTSEDIRRLRLSLGLTLKEFGELVGVTESAASSWETGRSSPRREPLAKINTLAQELANGTREPVTAGPVRRGPRIPHPA